MLTAHNPISAAVCKERDNALYKILNNQQQINTVVKHTGRHFETC